MTEIRVTTIVEVLDPDAVVRFSANLRHEAPRSVRGALAAVVINPARPPLEAGFVVRGVSCIKVEGGQGLYHVRVAADVIDRDKLVAEARSRHRIEWGDGCWYPRTLAHAVHEVLAGCNANPGSAETGCRVIGYRPDWDAPAYDVRDELDRVMRVLGARFADGALSVGQCDLMDDERMVGDVIGRILHACRRVSADDLDGDAVKVVMCLRADWQLGHERVSASEVIFQGRTIADLVAAYLERTPKEEEEAGEEDTSAMRP